MNENEIGTVVVDCSINLHKELGPGLLENVYETLLAYELESRGLKVERQVSIPLNYKGIDFKESFRADLLIEGKVVLEMKSIEHVSNAHKKQLLTYMKLMDCKLGYLLNFGEALMVDGITRTLNGFID
ncbi:GxxExxY protein [uncultured Desulfuromusa sp.]|uniref:GxxExxY protein n=1 Tax=uncultured Desulfuromusa sp. TaxID=219183 RepID=UPI002AA83ADC|nr:GxxExxY protein [uncultured Desulfuromusa sp.]